MGTLDNGLKREWLRLTAENAQLRLVLEKLACRHVTEAPLWWQIEARNALADTNGDRS